MQKRIKDQQFPNADLPKKGREKLDVCLRLAFIGKAFHSLPAEKKGDAELRPLYALLNIRLRYYVGLNSDA